MRKKELDELHYIMVAQMSNTNFREKLQKSA